MDTLNVVVASLAAGAAAALKPVAKSVVVDAYQALKLLIQDRYKINVDNLEQKPESTAQKAAIKERLESTEAASDQELLNQAQAVMEAVEAHDPQAARTAGVVIKNVKAHGFKADRVDVAHGTTGLNIEDSEFTDDVDAGTIITRGKPDPK